MTRIRKLLIANRGEIACRIMRTAKARGIKCVAVYSEADTNAMHVRLADEAYHIGASEPAQSYLNIDAVVAVAKRSNADAIHPGYGFLSERADFARACVNAGIIFVGPPAGAIAAMGDKAESKRRMIDAGVPCIPGYHGDDQSDATLIGEAEKVGFPVMVKASAGGGGRGMRVVKNKNDLSCAILSARKEAEAAFGSGALLLERAVAGARHVEVQVFADQHGNCVHLGERDCSLQRRNQKVIEEAPSPVISSDKRAEMGAAAVKAAQAVNYVGAGTVEFLYDPARDEFYFLEMNTRLQVEHPVTEFVTGLDLVSLQIDVAEGGKLSFQQTDIVIDGWAIEARLYAEDPAQEFAPHTGKAAILEFPATDALRIDSGIGQGDNVSAYYDPMIAKVIVHGPNRDVARQKLTSALVNTTLLGITHNRDFLISLLEDEGFANGEADTGYIEQNLDRLTKRSTPGGKAAMALVGAALIDRPFSDHLTGWVSRGESSFPLQLLSSSHETIQAEIKLSGSVVTSIVHGAEISIEVFDKSDDVIRYGHNGQVCYARYLKTGEDIEIDVDGAWERYKDLTLAPASDAASGDHIVKAPMAGLITSVRVAKGETVLKGSVLATIEAMKMEHQLIAPRDGVVENVMVKEGDQVAIRAKLITLENKE
ncbi:acetyl-CoA carboxylase biotin carboxylase subunit [Hyphococcus flavus]|uniref:Acetyl-CoA carboxylase biotin carboxylase subunit n=1 Tax=Hyphococcus flavus TaxID=1866326 RepID=A0AAE9ZC72_9PROT|nr:acetyl-CoA carboxylase biotin carboxylase subunit [Hyphococcus flavus]WDI31696.1 acetyl-CoA carboxylase biotin carboxylase subunit [Hyphococcus flavus]